MSSDNGLQIREGEIVEAPSVIAQLTRGEIETQIDVAKRYPRSLKQFQTEALEMATLDCDVAGECIYAIKRGTKTIEGPSARLAEIVLTAWTNCRGEARVIDEDGRFVTAQGTFFDIQRNVASRVEVKRRITNSSGKTYNDDMIGVTTNAAISIAYRNAIFKGIPKAFWWPIYRAAKDASLGGGNLKDKRQRMLEYFDGIGVKRDQVFALLEVKGDQDIGLDHLQLLRGIATALREGETTVEQQFGPQPRAGSRVTKSSVDVNSAKDESHGQQIK